MGEVAQIMAVDPQWQEDILEPVSVIGVNQVSHAGIQLMIRITVKRLRQWDVEREFRRRIKLNFDEQGIQIGIPKQTLSFYDPNLKEKFPPTDAIAWEKTTLKGRSINSNSIRIPDKLIN